MNNNQELIKRITPIFREVFNRADLVVSEELNATQVKEWDSLNHISLIVALEGEFGCEFSTEELAKMQKVGDLLDILRTKGVV